MSKDKKHLENEANELWTRDDKNGGIGEDYDFDNVDVEEADDNLFCGFEADIVIDVEKQLDDEFEKMERGDSE